MLKIKQLSFAYGKDSILSSISLTLKKGQIFGILGQNGAGKSTLLKCISGILNGSKNTCFFQEKTKHEWGAKNWAQKIAWVAPLPTPVFNFSVYDIVAMGRYPYSQIGGALSDTDHQMIKKQLQIFELSDIQNRDFSTLSSGQQQQVQLARAFAQDADILLLDEPFEHLDIKHQKQIAAMIKTAASHHQKSVVLTSHDINWVLMLCDQITGLKDGVLTDPLAPNAFIDQNRLTHVFDTEFDNLKGNIVGYWQI